MGRTTRRSTKSQSGTSTPPNISSPPSRPLFPSISLRSSSPTPPSHENLSARSSLLSVLTRPGHSVAATPDSPEEELSDLSTVSSYASSVISGTHSKDMTEEEIAKVYENYLEKPFVQTKTTIKHSEFGHCNNPNWRWTSQVSTAARVWRLVLKESGLTMSVEPQRSDPCRRCQTILYCAVKHILELHSTHHYRSHPRLLW